MNTILKMLILIVILFSRHHAFCQAKSDSVITSTSIDFGTTGHLFIPEWQVSYNNILSKFYSYNPNYYIKFFPNYSMIVTRNVGKKSFSIGYSINIADLSNKEYAYNKYFLNCFYTSFRFEPILENKYVAINPQFTLSYSKSVSSKYKVNFGDTPIKVYKESIEIGGGMQVKIPIYRKLYLNNSFDLLYLTYVPKLYLRHIVTLGYTF